MSHCVRSTPGGRRTRSRSGLAAVVRSCRTPLLTIAVLFTLAGTAGARVDSWLDGRWTGAIVRRNAVQLIDITLNADDSGVTGTYAIPDLDLYDEPLTQVTRDDSTLCFHVLYGVFTLRLHRDIDEMTGGREQWNPPLAMHLKRDTTPHPPRYTTEDLEIPVGSVTLAATLYEPAGAGPFPAVVVVPGSGDQSRADWTLRAHAYGQALCGVACLVYDKRGVGGSTGSYKDATFGNLARDATAAVGVLRSRGDIRHDAVGFMGVSQGGWIAAIAAHRDPTPDFVVFMEGPARSLYGQEIDRVRNEMTDDGFTAGAVDSAVAYTRLYLEVAGGARREPALARFARAARASAWAGRVSIVDSTGRDDDMRWWRRNAYDPRHDLSALPVPALVILGALDAAVPPRENRPLFERYLNAAGVSHRIVVIPNLHHAVATFQGLRGGRWAWPRAFWVWSKRPPGLDALTGNWIAKTTAAR